ncbi:MAG: universal stress protein [Proteobacteria bacterium]|nr:universal stress protein [Pseudomonadota bacterium]
MKNLIIVPITPSEVSQEVIRMADEWSKLTGAELQFIHVRSKNFLQSRKMLFSQDDELKKKDLAQMEKFVKAQSVTSNFKLMSLSGETHLKIIEKEEKFNPDFILMPAHSHTLLKRILLGSNADYITNNSRGPVYIYRKPSKRMNNSVVVPLDYSEINKSLVSQADEWAQLSGAELNFLHVADLPTDAHFSQDFVWLWDTAETDEPSGTRRVKNVTREQKEILERFLLPLNVKSKFKTFVEFGKPYSSIIELQESIKARLIMIAANSGNADKRNAIGSTTKYVINDAKCSTYIYKQG